MYKVIIKSKHSAVLEVCRTVDLDVAMYAYQFYIDKGVKWVLVNQMVGGMDEYWVTRHASDAVVKGE